MDTAGTWRSRIITDEDRRMAIARTQPMAGPVPHPVEGLKDESRREGFPPMRWRSRSAYRHRGSARSFAVNGRSRRKPRCVSPAISAARSQSGCAFRAYDLARAEADLAAKIATEVNPAGA
jgi:hypothetical protein